MGQSDCSRQFIRIAFADLDRPEFIQLARSPEFATYLIMRRYIWRSPQRHCRHLEDWYARGYLCCGLSRQKIARCVGGKVGLRTVSRDIARLEERRAIEVAGFSTGQVFVLGRWEVKDGVYSESYYLERLTATGATLAKSGKGSPKERSTGQHPVLCTVSTPLPNASSKNREYMDKTEGRTPIVPRQKSDTEVWKQVLAELRLQLTRNTFEVWVRPTTARRVDGRWEVTCISACARDWLEARLEGMIRRELSAATGERVDEITFGTG